jgi:antitoxin (DNA-binding transcriptional repressor) of toxin-antitoxin stability system
MISIGIRELKSHLSQFIELVKNGENILITDHNKIVAELKSPESKKILDNGVNKILTKLKNDGKIIPAKRKKKMIPTKGNTLLNQKDWWSLYQNSKKDI